MTRPNRHRIRRQIVEIGVGAIGDAPAIQQQLAGSFWERAVPELEDVFDRVAGTEELLRIDRLEVDLGTIGGSDWPSEFRRKLIAELTRSLDRFTPAPETDREDGRSEPRRAEPWRQFLFFLAHGRLPWWAAAPVERWTDVLSTGAEADWNALRETVSSDPRARARLASSVEDGALDRAVGYWTGVSDTARVLEQLSPSISDGDSRRRWRRGFWMLVLEWAARAGSRSRHGRQQLVRDLKMLRAMYETDAGPSRARPHMSREDAHHAGRDRAVAVDLPEPWRAWWLLPDDSAPVERAAPERRGTVGDARPRAPEAAPPRPERTRRNGEDEAIYLPGAGAILVHPFLEQLFRERGLLDGRNFRGLDARTRAVQMIGVITFGSVDVPEHELVLAKVLCGMPLEEPLEPVLLDDDVVAACDALVRAVLEHWTALRSSSPEWLRQHFFLREGKLEEVDEGHRLTIERHAQDVLLARLPWGFGVIDLPWMTDRIFVHWLD
jgi:hypothetical protein